MNRLVYVVTFSLLLSINLISQEAGLSSRWELVSGSSDGTDYYIDKEITTTVNGYKRVWVKDQPLDLSGIDLDKLDLGKKTSRTSKKSKSRKKKDIPTFDEYLRKQGEAYSSGLTLFEYNCDEKLIRIRAYTRYSRDGKVRSSMDLTNEVIDWENVVPDSIGESIYKIVCKK